MAGKFELDDNIDIKLGEPAYYSISGNELSDISAKPYFCGSFLTEVELNWSRNTVLKFKVGGMDKREIRGQVKRPDNTVTQGFRIKEKDGNACETVEKKCTVIIKGSDEDDVGRWYLTIWYRGGPANKMSARRTVTE